MCLCDLRHAHAYVLRQVYFFFSSRRRHTRLQGDWSSDVCSSDLGGDCRTIRDSRRSSERARPVASVTLLPHYWLSAGRTGEVGNGFSRLILGDRKSTRLNSSHLVISYAVFCLKKKKKKATTNNCTRCA